jgi:hypothetical protein
VKVTRNPYQLAAAACLLLAAILSSAGAGVISLLVLLAGLCLAVVAVIERRKYPRK